MTPRTVKNLIGVHPQLVAIITSSWTQLDKKLAAIGIRPEIICGLRPQAEQDRLYAQGRSRPGKIVTWTRVSKHNTGHAVDFGLFCLTTGKYLDEADPKRARAGYSLIAEILTPWKIKHGRSFGDDPHFELR